MMTVDRWPMCHLEVPASEAVQSMCCSVEVAKIYWQLIGGPNVTLRYQLLRQFSPRAALLKSQNVDLMAVDRWPICHLEVPASEAV